MKNNYYTYTNNSVYSEPHSAEQYPKDSFNKKSSDSIKSSIPDGSPAIPVNAYIIEEEGASSAPANKIGSVAAIVAGGAIALAGIPMLILPGPGLLAIGGGVALMAKGSKGLFASKKGSKVKA